MKVVILAGGFGTRLSEFTDVIPKPMVKVGDRPMIWHIMETYAKFGHKDFYLALGYKQEIFKDYFANWRNHASNMTIDFNEKSTTYHEKKNYDWRVTLVDTGQDTMTGGRVKRMKNFIGDETFLLTYGDGVANINLQDLVDCHKRNGKLCTVTAVRPLARFGELKTDNETVVSFEEKPQTVEGWINGGFFVVEPDFLNLIADDTSVLEKDPLETAVRLGQLACYRHEGYWQCMDTRRDVEDLNAKFAAGEMPWLPKL